MMAMFWSSLWMISMVSGFLQPKPSTSYPQLFKTALFNAHRAMYAVLVDADNAQAYTVKPILEEIVALGGDASVRRVYGDFTKQELQPWRDTALKYSFLPVNAFNYVSGKGNSDAALMIDAMELLFTNPSIDGFALVSSDSDFTRLAQRLREAGKHVVGFGMKHTPTPFVSACERFIYTENLDVSYVRKRVFGQLPKKTPLSSKDLSLLKRTIYDCSAEDEWVLLSMLGDSLSHIKSDFDPRSYGYNKLIKLVTDYPNHFELKVSENNPHEHFIRNCIDHEDDSDDTHVNNSGNNTTWSSGIGHLEQPSPSS